MIKSQNYEHQLDDFLLYLKFMTWKVPPMEKFKKFVQFENFEACSMEYIELEDKHLES